MSNACPRCGGNGQVSTPNGQLWQACPACGGSGKDQGREVPFYYVWDAPGAGGTLSASQLLRTQGPTMLGEADFVWKMTAGFQTAAYRIKFGFGGGGWLSSGGQGATQDFVRNICIIGTAQFPFPVWPHVVIPRSGKLIFDIEDLSAALNTVHICFIGALLYPSA